MNLFAKKHKHAMAMNTNMYKFWHNVNDKHKKIYNPQKKIQVVSSFFFLNHLIIFLHLIWPATKINKIFIPLRLININVHISLVLVQAPGHCYFSIKICSKIDCLCLTKLHFVMSKMIDFKIWNWIGYEICLLYRYFKII